GGTADRNRSHWSTSKTPSYTKSVSWQHHRLVMIFFLYMYVCFASAVYIPELWPTHLRLRGSGFVNAVGRIVAVFTPYGVAALLTHYGSITVFMVLGVMLVLCALVLSIFGIETRKVSLEEISEVN
ncbi:MFS transporter, partial [Escherichia coli]|uniref:MFS transporter n=8 Tax=Escherichia coli TaxID=562 RepID=UPI00207753AB